jgi:hypothetical protein
MKNKRLFAISGILAPILAPILFFGIVIILGLLESGYNHATRMMSVLGGVGGIMEKVLKSVQFYWQLEALV